MSEQFRFLVMFLFNFEETISPICDLLLQNILYSTAHVNQENGEGVEFGHWHLEWRSNSVVEDENAKKKMDKME